MTDTVQCECGHVVRLSSKYSGVRVLCPACGKHLAIGAEPAGDAGIGAGDFEGGAEWQGNAEFDGGEQAGGYEAPPQFRCGECGRTYLSSQVRRQRGRIVCMSCTAKQARAQKRAAAMARWAFSLVFIGAGAAAFYFIALPKIRHNHAAAAKDSEPAAKESGASKDEAAPPDDSNGSKSQAKPKPYERVVVIDKDGKRTISITDDPAPTPLPDPKPTTPTMPTPPVQPDPPPVSAGAVTLSQYIGARGVAIDPRGKRLVTYRPDRADRPKALEMKVWDVATGRALLHLAEPHVVADMVISPDGRWLMSAGKIGVNQPELRIWELDYGRLHLKQTILSQYGNVAFSADSKTAWCLVHARGIWTIDMSTKQASLYDGLGVSVSRAEFCLEPPLALVKHNTGDGGRARQWIDVFDLTRRRVIDKIDERQLLGSFAVARNGRYAAVGFRDTITLYDPDDWRPARRLRREGKVNAPQRLVFSHDGRYLVELPFGADGSAPIVWDLQNDQSVELPAGKCLDMAFTVDNKLAVACESAPVRLFDVAASREIEVP